MLHTLDLMAMAAQAGVVCNLGKALAFYHADHEQYVVEVGGEELLLAPQHDNPVDSVGYAAAIDGVAPEMVEQYVGALIFEGVFR